MFRLHDSTRRQICVAAFMGLCVLPTLAVAGWAIARRLPWNRQAEESRLSAELGLEVSIESLTHTLPGVVRYAGLKLTDPETRRELLRCDELEATWTSMTDSERQTRPAIVLAAQQVESAATAWERLEEVLRRRLECQSGRPEVEVRITAEHWTLRDGNESQTLESVEGGIGLKSQGIEAQLAFQLAGAKTHAPVRMRLARNRLVSPPANGFDLDTGPNYVPCRLLANCCKELNALGPDCRFSGCVSTFHSPGGWSGEVAGQFHGLDLASAAREGFTPAISGTADLALKLRFQQGRIDAMSGLLVSGAGTIGRREMDALSANLRLPLALQLPASGEPLAFDRIGLEFWIDGSGVSLAGHCDGMPGAIVVAGGRAVLMQPDTHAQPQQVAALIQAFAPANEARIPATPQSGLLARLLPAAVGTRR